MTDIKYNTLFLSDRIFVIKSNSKYLNERLSKPRMVEHRALGFLVDKLKPTDVFFDVGSNVGLYGLLVAQIVQQVHAFDFNKSACNHLLSLCKINDCDIKINNVAVLDSYDCLYVEKINGSMPNLSVKDIFGRDDVVRQIKLDSYGIIPTFVKIDVEGAEELVLRGMEQILKRKPKLMIEVHNHRGLDKFNSSMDGVVDILDQNNYDIKIIEDFRNKKHYNELGLIDVDRGCEYEQNLMLYAE